MQAYAPGFPWAAYFKAAGLETADKVVMRQNSAFPKVAAIFAQADLDTLKAWQAFSVIDQAAPLLSRNFVDAEFDFRSKFLNGQPEQRAQGFMGNYLERSMHLFLEQQQQFRQQMGGMIGQTPWTMLNQLTERNMELWKDFQKTLVGGSMGSPAGQRSREPGGKR